MKNNLYSKFSTSLKVRPDDIDMFNHVHNSKYLDYVLAARYEQMEIDYKMSMKEFLLSGFGWVVKTALINFKRPLNLGDEFIVSTTIQSINKVGCKVIFEIVNLKTKKVNADGDLDFVMIDLKSGKSSQLTQEMIDKYSI